MAEQIDVISRYSFWEVVGLLTAIIIVSSIVIAFLKKCYETLEKWRKHKNGIEDEKEDIEKRIEALEANDDKIEDSLAIISAGVEQIAATVDVLSTDLNAKLDTIKDENDKRSIVSNRTVLYRLHKQFTQQGEITLAEREMFDAVSGQYLALGGNAIFKSKIIPEVEALPIKD